MTERRWILAPRDSGLEERLANGLHISPVLAQLLINRDVRDVESGRAFLQPQLSGLHDPWLLPDMERASDRIRDAIRSGEKIVIYGDYDVDGISATALLLRCLKMAGANVEYYLPDRIEEGYGLNLKAVEKIIADGVQLIVTVDCGVGAMAEADLARSRGVDLIITDHHEPGHQLPNAFALVNPKIPTSRYPFKGLAGVGIAFKLAWALGKSFSAGAKVSEEFKDFLLDAVGLAALGTVADVVPLRDENRVLVKYGLGALEESAAPGIRALIELANLGDRPLDPYVVGFRLAPRLNAAGRLGDAKRSVELLTTESTERAKKIAEELDRENVRRQEIQRKIVDTVRRRIEEEFAGRPPHAIVLADEGWHVGVIGIVASKIAEEFNRPTVLISWDGDVGHGSGRSIENFHLYNALDRCAGMLLSFGGHAQAAGVRLERRNFPKFQEALVEFAQASLTPDDLVPTLHVDGEVMLAMLSRPLVKEIEMLAPLGDGNPAPVLAVSGVTVAGEIRRMGAEGKHISFFARQGDTSLRAVGFDKAHLAPALSQPGRLWSIAFAPKINRWNDREDVEMSIEDVKETK